MEKTYTFHSDGGHGWLAVKRSELVSLGIADKVSGYSYQKGDTVYLEEDCDLTLFMDVKQIESFKDLGVKESYHNTSPVRNYARYEVQS